MYNRDLKLTCQKTELLIPFTCKVAFLSHPRMSKDNSHSRLGHASLSSNPSTSHVSSTFTKYQHPTTTQHLLCPKPNHYHCLPPPWTLHFCPRALIIYSLTTARSDFIKHKTDHVTLLFKPLSDFSSQNKIQSLTMVWKSPPVTSPICLLLFFLLPTVFTLTSLMDHAGNSVWCFRVLAHAVLLLSSYLHGIIPHFLGLSSNMETTL